MSTQTQDASHRDGWSAWLRGRAADERHPRVRILHHCDLDRIGAISVPGAVAARPLTVGRNDPPFGCPNGVVCPIDDPHVSRDQLRLRWLSEPARFEISPAPGARRPVVVVDLDAGAAASPITGPTLLEPGACVAVGDRVLLGLELSRVRPADADRIGLVGESEAVWALRDEIASVAQFGRSALVSGPTGAGKELVARALHRQSPRASGPFVSVNCAALPESLVEATLFGHRKGAFTGADVEGKGLFRAADGGTLFLDELGELPLSVQPKLLRVLQDGIVAPVGSHEGKRVDVRVVAATHRDLEAQVRAGRMREDLYHRVAAHVLRVPSLVERRFDIPELFVHMLGRLRAEHPTLGWMWDRGRTWHHPLPIGFIAELMRRPWSGNVRELENLAERTARLNLHPGPFHAPDAPSEPVPVAMAGDPAGRPLAVGGDPPARSMASDAPPPPSVAPSGPAAPEGLVRAASEALGLAHKTVLKLFPPGGLATIGAEIEREGLDEAGRAARLRARAGEALLALLEARDYNQSTVATALGTSRTTLIKLMDDLGLPRATELTAEAIAEARREAGGDLDAAARLLRVSPSALKKRLTLLNLKARG